MTFAKKLRQIIILFFFITLMTSCEEGCFQSDEYSSELYTIEANPNNYRNNGSGVKQSVYGKYNDYDGGQVAEWIDTGLIASGEGFLLAISGSWISNYRADLGINDIEEKPSCPICIKGSLDQPNCFCGPRLEGGAFTPEVPPQKEKYTQAGSDNSTACGAGEHDNPDFCTCKPYGGDVKDLQRAPFFVFFTGSVGKNLDAQGRFQVKEAYDQEICKINMGVGAYIGLWGMDGNTRPDNAYHLFSIDRYCPANILKDNKCLDGKGNDRTRFLYRSPNNKIFVKKDDLPDGDINKYHQSGEVIKLNLYDQYYYDNVGAYQIEFLSGAIKKGGSGLLAEIVQSMDEFLFGSNYYDKTIGARVKKQGIVEFMYKAVLSDNNVGNIVTLSLVLYVCFYGLGFFMGIVDFGRKEVATRVLKIALVVAFTNKTSWQFYNDIVVGFFKTGMESIVMIVTSIFETNMERSLASIMANESTNIGVATKFVFIDNMIKDFLSKANVARIFGLLVLPNGKGFFALILIPAIFALIFYFLYTMLDVALKYLINLFKICIGLALGPVFILFSLFEKTKDMFKNWLSFVASRAVEIIFLLVMIHPFLLIIDNSFRMMMGYKVCAHNFGNEIVKFLIYKAEGINDRSLFQWFEYLLKIAALIFITKSIANKSAYISGQIVSIGGVGNADPVSESGKGQAGFSMGASIAKGIVAGAKGIFNSEAIAGNLKYGARLATTGLTKLGRMEIGRGGSINDAVNNAFKAVGIRNRGLRSFMRDREVDKAISLASLRADKEGLKGKDRNEFIRQEAMSSLNVFKNNNKNQAALLGLDNHNILKRMDQKLVKEPLKDFIKSRSAELKSEGVIGKEAREILRNEAQSWASENLSGGNPNRKVAEFFKKNSMKNFLRQNSEMSSSQAVDYSKKLLDAGKVDDAKAFVDKFTENSLKNNLRVQQKEQQSLKTGGKLVKGMVNIVRTPTNLGIKVVNKGIGVANMFLSKKLNKIDKKDKSDFIKATPEFIKKATGSIDNYAGKLRKEVKRAIPFSVDGGAKSNPKNNLRKFDRKFTRMMAEKMRESGDDKKAELKDKFGLRDLQAQSFSLKVKESDNLRTKIGKKLLQPFFLKIKDGDSEGKVAKKLVGKLITAPAMPIAYVVTKGYKAYRKRFTKDKQEFEFKEVHNDKKIKALKSIADKELKNLQKNLDSQISQAKESIASGYKSEVIKINGENKLVSYYRGEKKQDNLKEFDKRLEEFKRQKDYNKPVSNLNLLLKDIDNKVKNQEKLDSYQVISDLQKNTNIKSGGQYEELRDSYNKPKLQRLQDFDQNNSSTVLEKLARLEQVKNLIDNKDNIDLKKRFQSEINQIIADKIEELKKETDNDKINDETAKLDKLKNALTADMHSPENSDIISDVKSAFDRAVNPGREDRNQDTITKLDEAMGRSSLGDLIYDGYEKIARFKANDLPEDPTSRALSDNNGFTSDR